MIKNYTTIQNQRAYFQNKTGIIKTYHCPIHGDYKMDEGTFKTSNQPCRKCFYIERSEKTLIDRTLDFISQAKQLHQSKYTYENIQYTNAHQKVNITCPEHGQFTQTPDHHLSGGKCPKCSGQTLQTELF